MHETATRCLLSEVTLQYRRGLGVKLAEEVIAAAYVYVWGV